MRPVNIVHKKCSRQPEKWSSVVHKKCWGRAEKWTSVSPCLEAGVEGLEPGVHLQVVTDGIVQILQRVRRIPECSGANWN